MSFLRCCGRKVNGGVFFALSGMWWRELPVHEQLLQNLYNSVRRLMNRTLPSLQFLWEFSKSSLVTYLNSPFISRSAQEARYSPFWKICARSFMDSTRIHTECFSRSSFEGSSRNSSENYSKVSLDILSGIALEICSKNFSRISSWRSLRSSLKSFSRNFSLCYSRSGPDNSSGNSFSNK